ncbi:hypothetical protein CDL15_Pgr009216 [Punica granatum]|uniref:Uncharacterized protein n=1 Tax=Punica granatum TaxID=22663 RepID=A0A218WWR6_PUNGR|nr:hypothetical protein CDL15_Pgr009216 [Punica granatum]
MEGAEEELERRSKFLSGLIQSKKAAEQHDRLNVRVRASDMPLPLQNRAFRCARDHLDSMPRGKLDSKRLALALKKVPPLLPHSLTHLGFVVAIVSSLLIGSV